MWGKVLSQWQAEVSNSDYLAQREAPFLLNSQGELLDQHRDR